MKKSFPLSLLLSDIGLMEACQDQEAQRRRYRERGRERLKPGAESRASVHHGEWVAWQAVRWQERKPEMSFQFKAKLQ